QTVFDNKPIIQYNLSHSFRFGAVIAQCAYNTISFNTNRVQKSLVAHSIEKPADIFIVEQTLDQSTDTSKELASQVLSLVKEKNVHPSNIIVLCRMFAQLSNLEAEFISRKIPYRVLGQKPFFERREVKVLLNYLQLAIFYHMPITEKVKEMFLYVANTPNRMLARRDLERLMDFGLENQITLAQALEMFAESPQSPLSDRQRQRVLELMSALQRTNKRISSAPNIPTYQLLSDLIEAIGYLKPFDDFYGKGEASFDRKESILNFVDFARALGLPPSEFLAHIAKMDTTRGAPEDQQIVMTTVFRTKGLEYDYVIIPNCNEGYMPCLYGSDNRIFDKQGIVREPEPSEALENERRLFYVAITRARNAVYIGTGSYRQNSQSPKHSRFLDEIRYEPTLKIMSALQQYASGKREARLNLLSNLAKFGGIRSIVQNLLAHYFVMLDDHSLISEAARVISSCPEIPFSYRFAYSLRQETKQNDTKAKLHSAWDDVEI
ncbi:MAG: ATP-dependent helicase, partial [Anaerolineales bacterium]|nr:ATP-dependent helicase [Anaerolineales bacterium]